MYIAQLVGLMNFMQVMTLHMVGQIFPIVLTSPAYFWAYGGLSLLGLTSVLVRM